MTAATLQGFLLLRYAKGPKACNLTDVKSYEFGIGLATGEQLFAEQLVLAAAWGLGAAAI